MEHVNCNKGLPNFNFVPRLIFVSKHTLTQGKKVSSEIAKINCFFPLFQLYGQKPSPIPLTRNKKYKLECPNKHEHVEQSSEHCGNK